MIKGENTMIPDQTAPREQYDLGSYCLQFRLLKNISRQETRWQVMLGGEKIFLKNPPFSM